MNVWTIILWEWGRRPHRSITLALCPSFSFLFLCLLSVTHPLTVLLPFYSTDPCLTHVSQHATDLCGTLLHQSCWIWPASNNCAAFVYHKPLTSSSTWWTVFSTWPYSFVLVLTVCNLIFWFTLNLKCYAFQFNITYTMWLAAIIND